MSQERYSEADYADALGGAIESAEWAIKGIDADDPFRVENEKAVRVLRHLYQWHAGVEYPAELRFADGTTNA